jgi:hypothetical protein
MATPEWIKKLTKDKDKKKQKLDLDKEKMEKFKESYGNRFEKLKKRILGK